MHQHTEQHKFAVYVHMNGPDPGLKVIRPLFLYKLSWFNNGLRYTTNRANRAMIFNLDNIVILVSLINVLVINGSQLAKMKKNIPDMSLP